MLLPVTPLCNQVIVFVEVMFIVTRYALLLFVKGRLEQLRSPPLPSSSEFELLISCRIILMFALRFLLSYIKSKHREMVLGIW